MISRSSTRTSGVSSDRSIGWSWWFVGQLWISPFALRLHVEENAPCNSGAIRKEGYRLVYRQLYSYRALRTYDHDESEEGLGACQLNHSGQIPRLRDEVISIEGKRVYDKTRCCMPSVISWFGNTLKHLWFKDFVTILKSLMPFLPTTRIYGRFS